MPEVCCAHCGRKLSSRNVKVCPRCHQRLYKTKGDIVNCDTDRNCPTCKGTGKVPGLVLEGRVITWLRCPKCKGKGKVRC